MGRRLDTPDLELPQSVKGLGCSTPAYRETLGSLGLNLDNIKKRRCPMLGSFGETCSDLSCLPVGVPAWRLPDCFPLLSLFLSRKVVYNAYFH